MMLGRFYLDLNIEFSDVKFLRATSIVKDKEVTFVVMIHRGTGAFEISEASSPVVTGTIKVLETVKFSEMFPVDGPSDTVVLDTRNFYKELRLRGYHYKDEFRSVVQARSDGSGGQIQWSLNFATFMDCMLQLNILALDTRNLMIPIGIERIQINTNLHYQIAKQINTSEDAIMEVQICSVTKTIRAGGIEIRGMKVDTIARRKPPGEPVLESYKFVPSFPTPVISAYQAARIIVQLGQENTRDLKVKTLELDNNNLDPIIHLFHESLGDLPLVTAESVILSQREHNLLGVVVDAEKLGSNHTNCSFIIAPNLVQDQQLANSLLKNLKDHAYLISREVIDFDPAQVIIPSSTRLVYVVQTEIETLLVLQYQKKKVLPNFTIVKVSSKDTRYEWIQEIKNAVVGGPVVVVAQYEPLSGILGLVNCLRAEPNGSLISCFFIDDPEAPPFDPAHPLYSNQIRLGLAVNVFRQVGSKLLMRISIPKRDQFVFFLFAGTMGHLSAPGY